MSSDQSSRVATQLARSITSALDQEAATWSARSIEHALRQLAESRGHPQWIANLATAIVTSFPETPELQSLEDWMGDSPAYQQAFRRSPRLRALAEVKLGPTPQIKRDPTQHIATQLADRRWDVTVIAQVLSELSGVPAGEFGQLSHQLVNSLGADRPSAARVARHLREHNEFQRQLKKHPALRRIEFANQTPAMHPTHGVPQQWRVPALTTPAEVAAWLAIHPQELHWLATSASGGSNKQGHYQRRWSPKRRGGWRLIEAPKLRLKRTQRDILDGILRHIPPHNAVHGFHPGRNIRSFAAPHVGQPFCLRMDLLDFFPSVRRVRIAAIFRTAGYPDTTSQLLSHLTTTCTPRTVLNVQSLTLTSRDVFSAPHLPQGAPTSPYLANLAAYRLDCRLSGLARKFGATYTRYADDLLFSGGESLKADAKRFHIFALSIVLEEGFRINPRKTRMMPAAGRQQAAGLVLNHRVNTGRQDYERLKATLHNCQRFGPDSQNRDGHANFAAHLLGRVQFHQHINPNRGRKLKEAYDAAFVGDSTDTAVI